MALGKVLVGSWASNGPLQGLGRLLGSSWKDLGRLLGALGPSQGLLETPAKLRGASRGTLGALLGRSGGALGPSCGSTSESELFKKGHDRFLLNCVAKTLVFVRDHDLDVQNIVCF